MNKYIQFKKDDDYLLSKKDLTAFIDKYNKELVNNNWDAIFVDLGRTAFSDRMHYPSIIYTLLYYNIEFLDYITQIWYGLFSDCDFIVSIRIPNNIKAIEENAFYRCRGVKSIKIPPSVTVMDGLSIFKGCISLKTLYIPLRFNLVSAAWSFDDDDYDSVHAPQILISSTNS